MSQSYVVFGAYGGVGSALCRRLAKKGAHLLWAGRNDMGLNADSGQTATKPYIASANYINRMSD